MLNCIDNSGAAVVECALIVGQRRHATIGTKTEPPLPNDPRIDSLKQIMLFACLPTLQTHLCLAPDDT